MDSANNTRMPTSEEDSYHYYLIFDIVTYIIGAFIVLVNSSILLAFIIQKCRQVKLARLTPAGLLVLNLLISDILIGAINILNTATQDRNKARYPYWCLARVAITYFGLVGSHVALINVAVDRYVAIMHTLHYRDWMSKRRSVSMICFGWLVPISGGIGALLSNNWRPGLSLCSEIAGFRAFLSFVWIPSHLLALIIVIIVQCRMYLHLKHHESTPSTSTTLRRYSHKSAQVLYRVTSTFLLCWGPFDVLLLTIVFFPNPIVKVVYDVTSVMAYLSFLVNPCIFSYKTESIRKPVSALYEEIKQAVVCNTKDAAGVTTQPNGQSHQDNRSRVTRHSSSLSSSAATQSNSLSTSMETVAHNSFALSASVSIEAVGHI